MYVDPNERYLLFLYDFNKILISSIDFQKILRYQILFKSVLWEPSCPILTEGRTDGLKNRHDEANIIALSQFYESA